MDENDPYHDDAEGHAHSQALPEPKSYFLPDPGPDTRTPTTARPRTDAESACAKSKLRALSDRLLKATSPDQIVDARVVWLLSSKPLSTPEQIGHALMVVQHVGERFRNDHQEGSPEVFPIGGFWDVWGRVVSALCKLADDMRVEVDDPQRRTVAPSYDEVDRLGWEWGQVPVKQIELLLQEAERVVSFLGPDHSHAVSWLYARTKSIRAIRKKA